MDALESQEISLVIAGIERSAAALDEVRCALSDNVNISAPILSSSMMPLREQLRHSMRVAIDSHAVLNVVANLKKAAACLNCICSPRDDNSRILAST